MNERRVSFLAQNCVPEDIACRMVNWTDEGALVMHGLFLGNDRNQKVVNQRGHIDEYISSPNLNLELGLSAEDYLVSQSISRYRKIISVWELPDEVLLFASKFLIDDPNSR